MALVDVTTIGIGVDTGKLRQGTKELDNFGKGASNAANKADNLNGVLNKSAKEASNVSNVFRNLAVVLGAGGLAKSLVGFADNYTKLTAQIKNATSSQEEYNQAFADVQRIAKTAQADLSAVSALYARLNLALKDSGSSLKEVGRITESVALTLKASGASAGETSSVMLQLSQAFGAGALRSEEFNAVAENAPSILRAVATAMGVQVGQLKSMAAEGQITNDVLKEVLGSDAYLESVRNQAKEMQTVSGAWTQLMNDITLAIGQADNVTDASRNIANGIGLISEQIVNLINFITENRQTIGILLEIYGIAKGARAGAAIGGAVGAPQIGAVLGGGAALLGIEAIKDEISSVNRELTRTEELTGRITRSQNAIKNLLSSPLRRNETLDSRNAKVRDYVSNISKYQIELNNLTSELPKIETPAIVSDSELKAAQRARDKIREEALKDIQNEIDFEMDIKETRDKAELKAIDDAKELQLKADKEVAEARDKYMDVQQKRADENFKEAQEVYKKQVSEYEKIFDRANENLARSLTDSIIRGFDNGKKFIQNFKDAIANAFKGYFVNIGVNFVQNAISGVMGDVGKSVASAFGFGNGAAPAGGGFGGVMTDLGSIFTKSNQSIFSGIESLGAKIANGMGGIRDTIGGYLGANASFVANAASYAGAVLQLAQGNWAGAAGTAIGTYFGGPVGGAIGSFLGNAVGSLFGGKAKTSKFSTGAKTSYADGKMTSSQGLSGLAGYGKDLGGSDGLAQLGEQYSKLMGSLFKAFDMSDAVNTSSSMFQRSSSKTRSWAYFGADFGSGGGFNEQPVGGRQDANETMKQLVEWVLGKGVVKGVQSSKLPDAIKDLFNGITTEAEAMNMINATITLGNANQALIDSFNLTAIEAAKVAVVSGQTGDELAKVVALLAAAGNESRKIGDALFEFRNMLKDAMGGTIYNSMKDFDNALKGIDKSTQAGIEAFYELFSLRGDFAKFTQAIDGLRGGVKGALFSIVSDAEKQQMLNNDLATMFAELNMTVPGSIQELISLGKSIDYTTAEGLNLASVFPTLVDAFNTTRGAVDSLINSLTSSRFETFADFAIGSSLARQGVGLNQIPVRGASQGTDNQVAVLLTRLIAEVSEMKQSTQQTADNTLRTTRELEDIAGGNVTLSTQAA